MPLSGGTGSTLQVPCDADQMDLRTDLQRYVRNDLLVYVFIIS